MEQLAEEQRKKKEARKNAYTGAMSDNEDSYESDDMALEQDDKFGGVNQKDLDKITGGMQTVRESKLNLGSIERMIPPEECFGRPS